MEIEKSERESERKTTIEFLIVPEDVVFYSHSR